MENNTIQHAKRKAKIYELIANYQEKIEKATKNSREGNRYAAKEFHSPSSHWIKFTASDDYEQSTEEGLVTMSEEFKYELHELVLQSYISSCRYHIDTLKEELGRLMPQTL